MKRLMRSASLVSGLLLILQAGAGEARIEVDASKSLGPVNRHVFGHNVEAADGRGIFGEKPGAAKFDTLGTKCAQGYWNPELKSSNPEIVAITKELGVGMLRYPGGCLVHNFDWRKAVGPLSERGDWQFGIDEYIKLCRELGAEPLITITDYAFPASEIPKNAAELVEYLNSPATPEHPWAMKRKEWGNPEPYGVKWFELGNETDHGNHNCIPSRRYTPEEYVAYANACGAAMKKVDPSIKTGVLTVPGGCEDFDCAWNMAVYKGACPTADFLIIHVYGPAVDSLDAESCFKAAMAYGDQLEWRMKQYSDLTEKFGGRRLPLAVTEYNIYSIDAKSPHRFSFTAGLLCADMMRIYLNPANNVANAEFWQVINGYWSMLRSKDGKITERRAALPFFQLWGRHFGDTLVSAEVSGSPRFETPAFSRVAASRGDAMRPSAKLCDASLEPFDLKRLNAQGFAAESPSPDALSIKLENCSKDSYPELSRFLKPQGIQAGDGFVAKISFEAKFTPAKGSSAKLATLGLGICDIRGWDKTKSAIAVCGAQEAADWTPFEGDFTTRGDCPGSTVQLRVEKLAGPVSGTLEFRKVKVELSTQATWPAYQGLTASSSLSKDGNTLYLMVFNKSLKDAIDAVVDLKGFKASSAKSWLLTQGEMSSTVCFEAKEEEVPVSGSQLKRSFPAHSMTAIEFVRGK